MNVELLQKVKAHILEEPRRLNMGNWVALKEHTGVLPMLYGRQAANEPPCGTVACVAGWAVLLSRFNGNGKDYAKFLQVIFGGDAKTADFGKEDLGLTTSQAEAMFYVGRWPDRFREAHEEAENDGDLARMAQVTADRIDFMIAEPDHPENNYHPPAPYLDDDDDFGDGGYDADFGDGGDDDE